MYCFIYCKLCYNCTNSSVLLYDTDNREKTQAYDCIHYGGAVYHLDNVQSTQSIKYCVRPTDFVSVDRNDSQGCFNGGTLVSFDELKRLNVTTQELLKWNSGVSIIDRYRAYLISDQSG